MYKNALSQLCFVTYNCYSLDYASIKTQPTNVSQPLHWLVDILPNNRDKNQNYFLFSFAVVAVFTTTTSTTTNTTTITTTTTFRSYFVIISEIFYAKYVFYLCCSRRISQISQDSLRNLKSTIVLEDLF